MRSSYRRLIRRRTLNGYRGCHEVNLTAKLLTEGIALSRGPKSPELKVPQAKRRKVQTLFELPQRGQ